MFPISNEQAQSGGNLEDRLRGMILGNTNTNRSPHSTSEHTPFAPQLLSTTRTLNATEQQEHSSRHAPQPVQISGGLPSPSRKRPNQAQRRQMKSQLPMPIDQHHDPSAGQITKGFNLQSTPPRERPQHQGGSQVHQFQQNLQYSPQGVSLASPHSPRSQNSHPSPRSPWNHYQTNQSPSQFPLKQTSNQVRKHSSQNHARGLIQNQEPHQPISNHGYGRGKSIERGNEIMLQSAYLDTLVHEHVSIAAIDDQEVLEKESFRSLIEQKCRAAITRHEKEVLSNKNFDPSTVELRCFGSMASGFATKGSDMDLALLTPRSNPLPDSPESIIPRLLEKTLLDLGYGARLLTRTRVPIIKLCERPTNKLLADLLEERSKWETGFVAETAHEEIDLLVGSEEMQGHEDAEPVDPIYVPRENTVQRRSVTYEDNSIFLKQKNNQTIGDYYNTAKRLLRQLGGRDVSASAPDLTEEESKTLNDVCKAFILGLSSQALSNRLQNYKSISPLFDTIRLVTRSLQGVWNQVEGENLALAWDTRPLSQSNDRDEFDGLQSIQAWRALQNKDVHLIETIVYNRQLYTALERLKKISSLQLAFLQQVPHEDPLYYLSRAQKLLDDLTTHEKPETNKAIPIIISYYISGISNDSIRRSLAELPHDGASLRQIGLQHCALQLALDYEHALKTGMFSEDSKAAITQYIQFLRSRTLDSKASFDTIQASLLAKIRNLPDPTRISLNKPRDRYKDHLEFPKTDIGIQCDINFSADLAIHNTLLLRCYSHTDTRIRDMVLFVKFWAKTRAINTPYRGTLSSYGYVLMVLHYLINVVQPYVCPNLQTMNSDPPSYLSPAEREARTFCKGRDVRFWRNETEIQNLARRKLLNHNRDSIGMLLRGFFEYFAQNGQMSTANCRGFDWGREVLSLKTPGGILTKQQKGWVGAKTIVETTTRAVPSLALPLQSAKTSNISEARSIYEPNVKTSKLYNNVMEETKEIRHRYLFAIEDPFELDHNVARTVTHNGIVSIRDEFRRAWRIIRGVGKSYEGHEGGLLDTISTSQDTSGLYILLDLLHGPPPKTDTGKPKCDHKE